MPGLLHSAIMKSRRASGGHSSPTRGRATSTVARMLVMASIHLRQTPPSRRSPSHLNYSGSFAGDRTGDRRETAQSPGPSVTHGGNPTDRVTDGAGDRRETAQSPVQSPGNPLFSGKGDRVTDGHPTGERYMRRQLFAVER